MADAGAGAATARDKMVAAAAADKTQRTAMLVIGGWRRLGEGERNVREGGMKEDEGGQR